MATPADRATAALTAGPGRSAAVDINGFALEVPADDREAPAGPTAFGLLAAALSACTAMSVRTFLERSQVPHDGIEIDVRMSGTDAELDRHVHVAALLTPDLREQLAGIVDSTPVTMLLRDSVTIVTRLSSEPAEEAG